MTKIGKKLAAVLLAVAMVITFIPVLGTETAYATSVTKINSIALNVDSDFETPNIGDPITYPSVTVTSTDPAGLEGILTVSSWWYNFSSDVSYFESSGDTGVFTEGTWFLYISVKLPDDTYTIDKTDFTPQNITLGGKDFFAIFDDDGIRYRTDFYPTSAVPVLADMTLETGYVGGGYSQKLKVTGAAPVTFSLESGTLPPGLTLSEDGRITGNCETAGNYSFTVKAANSYGNATKEYSISVESRTLVRSILLSVTSDFETPNIGDSITYPSIAVASTDPAGLESLLSVSTWWYDYSSNTSYSESSGDTGIFTEGDWFLYISVKLPDDTYAIDESNFAPQNMTLGGKDFFVIFDSDGIRYRTTFKPTSAIPVFSDKTLSNGYVGSDYSQTIEVISSSLVTFSLESGTLPAGLTLSEDGIIEGTCTEEGEYNFTIKATNEGGSSTKEFSITVYRVTKPLNEATTTVEAVSAQTYTGKAIKPVPVVKYGDITLVKGADYEVSYKNNTNAGTATVVITGKGNYTGTIEKTFTIAPKKITPAVTLSASAYTWNGKVKKPAVTVKDGSTKLAASDYTVTYKNNKNVGKASAVVTLKGNYSGSKAVSFKINPKGTSLKTLTKASKAVTVKWTKQASKMSSSRITGYQIQLATDSKFTKNKKLVTVKGYSKTSKKVTKLKGGKKYYVRIRTYKTVNGTKYYSPWSKVKTVTTKK